ncbi:MAG: hypothetical protein CML59_07155 [Rhodobacteraceae bacterium]|nr:hypothetical protein [Paracoccaceae bacterium]
MTLYRGLQGVLRGCFLPACDHPPFGEAAVFHLQFLFSRLGSCKFTEFLIEVGKEVAARALPQVSLHYV